MERCVNYDGRVFRKRRRQFDTFLHHENPRIRAAAEELIADRKLVQEEWQQMEWEYESYHLVEEVLREIECELAAINLELTEAAEMDRPSDNYAFHPWPDSAPSHSGDETIRLVMIQHPRD